MLNLRRRLSALFLAGLALAWTHGNAHAPTWWVDVSVTADCSGNTDSTMALQNLYNTLPNNYAIGVPLGCTLVISSPITATSLVGPKLFSFANVENSDSNAPTLKWNGSGTGPMFSFTSVDHPTFSGLAFTVASGKTINGFISLDGTGATLGRIEQNTFDASAQSNASFNAIYVSQTSGNNNEDTLIQDNVFNCSGAGNGNTQRATNGVTSSGSPNVQASGTFVGGDVGKRILVSWAGGAVDTTIKTVTDGTHIVLNANVPSTQTNVTINTGAGLGIGFHNGNSANAKHQKIYRNRFTNCAIGIYSESGSIDVDFFEGYQNDIAIRIGQTIEGSNISHYEDEQDMRFLQVDDTGNPITLNSPRFSMNNARADGYVYLGGGAQLLVYSGTTESTLQTNAVIFGFAAGHTQLVTAINNNWGNNTFAQVNYAAATTLTVLCDTSVDNNFGFAGCSNRFTNLPTSSAGLATGTMWNSSGVLNIK